MSNDDTRKSRWGGGNGELKKSHTHVSLKDNLEVQNSF